MNTYPDYDAILEWNDAQYDVELERPTDIIEVTAERRQARYGLIRLIQDIRNGYYG